MATAFINDTVEFVVDFTELDEETITITMPRSGTVIEYYVISQEAPSTSIRMIKGAAFDPAKQVAVATSDTTELGTVSYATVINPANASFLAGDKAFFLNDNKGGGGLAKTVIRYACPGVPLGTVVTKVVPKK